MTTPYAGATAGTRARDETQKILRRLGCDQVGFMDDHVKHELLVAFTSESKLSIQSVSQRLGLAVPKRKSLPLQNAEIED